MSAAFEVVSAKLVNPPQPLHPEREDQLVFGVFRLRYGVLEIEGAQLVCHLDGRRNRQAHQGTFRMHFPGRGRARRMRIADPAIREQLVMAALVSLSGSPSASAESQPVAKASSHQETNA